MTAPKISKNATYRFVLSGRDGGGLKASCRPDDVGSFTSAGTGEMTKGDQAQAKQMDKKAKTITGPSEGLGSLRDDI
jgi:hypothetical protein